MLVLLSGCSLLTNCDVVITTTVNESMKSMIIPIPSSACSGYYGRCEERGGVLGDNNGRLDNKHYACHYYIKESFDNYMDWREWYINKTK